MASEQAQPPEGLEETVASLFMERQRAERADLWKRLVIAGTASSLDFNLIEVADDVTKAFAERFQRVPQ